MNKYLECEFNAEEIAYLIQTGGFSYEQIIFNSLKKIKSACLKNRVKNVLVGIDAGPDEILDKILGSDMLARAILQQKLGFDFINLNLAQYLAISYFQSPAKKPAASFDSILPKYHYDVCRELFSKLKNKLEFTIHLPTDDFIYEDAEDKLFNSCLHLAQELGTIIPQNRLPLSFHAYRTNKTTDFDHDLKVSKNETADLIVRTARFLQHLERKRKLRITLALEMTNQELPSSHYVRYCTSPYQVLEVYYLAKQKDKTGLVEKYLNAGIFSVTFDTGHFLLDQKFHELLLNPDRHFLSQSLYFGFEEFCRKISLFHVSVILDKNYLNRYLDNRRTNEFFTKFGKEHTHHCPILITDTDKVGEVLKQVELFSNMSEE